jgi:cytidine deaminase
MNEQTPDAADHERLLWAARAAAKNAYARYSKFHVGAAVLTESGEIVAGCNVENASYGLTMCAERAAIFAAVAQFGPEVRIRAVLVVNGDDAPCSPCGACRQVIYEFGPQATVIFQASSGWTRQAITDLLPYGFRLT